MENNIGVRIEQFIAFKKISKKIFFEQCKISRQTFSKWKRGVYKATIKSVEPIIIAFPEISADWLYNGNGSMLKDESIIFHETESEYGGCKLCKEKDIQIKIYLEYINTLKEKLSEHQKQCEKRRAV